MILYYSFTKPMVGLALLLQINIIRALVGLDLLDPCFDCLEPDIVLGAITPILAFIIIIIRLRLNGRLKYVFDYYDVYFVFTILTLIITTVYAKNFLDAFNHTLKYIFLGSSYYFMSKLILINIKEPYKALRQFLRCSIKLAVFFGFLGAYFYLFKGENVYRLTLPTVHPIPFSQLIGLGIFISFLVFISNGKLIGIKSKAVINFNKVLILALLLILFGTNTRGVMLSLALALLLYAVVSKLKIPKKTLYISGVLILISLVVIVNYIDYEVLFSRILNTKHTAKSIGDRYIAYEDSILLFFDYPFGIGGANFKYYSILPYTHNFFLENIAEYGIFGLFNIFYFIVLVFYMLLLSIKHSIRSNWFILILSLFVYYFIESMFSFTLWMHKGMYLMIGVFAAHHYLFRKNQVKQ